MNASESVWACIGTAVGLLLIATYGWDAWHKRRTTRRWQTTARQAARRTEDDVRRDLADAKAAIEIQQLEAWLATPSRPRNTIPHQTRRTEEDR